MAAFICAATVGDAVAQRLAPELPGDTQQLVWSDEQVATLRSFFERVDVEDALVGVRSPPVLGGASTLGAVASGLGADWEAPFRFVQGAIGYVPYTGSIRGARGTLLAGAGNALDRSLLLEALYRARGVQTRLVNGDLRWDHAVALVGSSRADRLSRGDPWLRWVEIAADHWWVEARRDGRWVGLDAAFQGEPGAVFAVGRKVVGEVPSTLRATVRIDVLHGERPITTAVFPLPELIGEPIRLVARKLLDAPEAQALDAARPRTRSIWSARDGRAFGNGFPPRSLPAAELLATVLPRIPPGPVMLELLVEGTSFEAGPVERAALSDVSLRVRTSVPVGPGNEMRLPWGERGDAQLVVLLGGGRVHRNYLAQSGMRIHAALKALVAAELLAMQEFAERGGDDGDEALDGIRGMPGSGSGDAGARDNEGLYSALHPADALHVAAVRAWLEFESHGAGVVAAALLAATDQLEADVQIQRPGVRMVGFNWQLPDAGMAGALTTWLQDPIDVGGVDRGQRRGIQAAYGLLRSALLGHVLNSIADRPPTTAFDVTLRTVGSGHRLVWWQPGGALPTEWPDGPRGEAGRDRSAGRTLIGPSEPIRRQEESLLAWWALLQESGTTEGRIVAPIGVAQGSVPFVESRDYEDLESLLATLRDLHRASRWLIAVADHDNDVLGELLPRACAATGLVAELLLAGAPPNWQPPMFAEFCDHLGADRGRVSSQP